MESAFALSFEGRLADALRASGVPVSITGEVRGRRPWKVRAARRLLSQAVSARRPHVAVVHSSWSQAIFGPTILAAGVPLVRWLHAPQAGPAILEWTATRNRVALVVCNSHYTCQATTIRFGDARREVCYAPVALEPPQVEDRATVRRQLGVPADALVIAIAARMEPWKGHRVLLDAVGGLQDDARWHAVVMGGAQGPSEAGYLRGLEAQAERLGIASRVSFLGEREDVSRVLAASDIYCQPNEDPEPFGLSYVEALGAGLPVVASRLGALPEIVDRRCGILVESGSAAAVRAALQALLNPERRRTMGLNAVARARDFGDLAHSMSHLAAALAGAATLSDRDSMTVRS
jgi:glycosyltransferase involved in cell wall biosynthesis